MQEASTSTTSAIPPFQVERLGGAQSFTTQSAKKSEAKTKLLSLRFPGWMEDTGKTEFIARYRLDETFMLSIAKDSTVCYVDDSFLIAVTNKQIYINGKADGPDWTHTFQYASIVSDIPCIVTATTANRRTAMHLFYGNDRYDIPNCKHISISPSGAVWWIDLHGNEYHTSISDLIGKTPVHPKTSELPANLTIAAIHTTSDDTEIILGTQPDDQQRKSWKLLRNGVPMDIWELASIKELGAYSFEGDLLYLKYTDFSNHQWEINVHPLSDRVRKEANNTTVGLQRKVNARLDRIIKKVGWTNQELIANINQKEAEIKELKKQLSVLKPEMNNLKNTNSKLSAQNTELQSYMQKVIQSLITATGSRKLFGVSQLPFTVRGILRDHDKREKTTEPPIS